MYLANSYLRHWILSNKDSTALFNSKSKASEESFTNFYNPTSIDSISLEVTYNERAL